MNSKSSFSYISGLDGLRGVAILFVMLHHSGLHLFRGGFIGVDVFFIISGYLITSIIIKEFKNTSIINLKNFYIRRILRLLPLLFLLLLIYDAVCFALFDKQTVRTHIIDSLIAFFYMTNWSWAFSLHPPDILRHTWSLAVEEQFYLLWPPLIFFLLRRVNSRKSIAAVALFLALLSWIIRIVMFYNGASIYRLYNGLDTRFDSLMVGAAIGIVLGYDLIEDTMQRKIQTITRAVCPVAVMLLFVICIKVDYRSPAVYTWIIAAVNILGSIVIFDLVKNDQSRIKRVLTLKWLVWVGKISYGLYLIHYLVFRVMFYYGFDYKLIILLGSGVSIVLSSLSYIYLERPFLNMKRKFSYASVES